MSDHLWGALAVGAVIGLATYGLIRALRDAAAIARLRRDARTASPQPGQLPTPQPGEYFTPLPAWRALLGNRIALRDTGFEIEMRLSDPHGRTYWLWSPEGLPVASAGPTTLQSLKAMAEQMAEERKEFEQRAELWKP